MILIRIAPQFHHRFIHGCRGVEERDKRLAILADETLDNYDLIEIPPDQATRIDPVLTSAGVAFPWNLHFLIIPLKKWHIPGMSDKIDVMPRTIILSAHLDDAILSLGGWIADQTRKSDKVIIIWTIFCGTPPDKPKENYEARIAENRVAVDLVGAGHYEAMFPDAFERGHATVNEPIDPSKDEFVADLLIEHLKTNINPETRILVPLAVGEHNDHVLLRHCAEQLKIPLIYYIDFPYIDYVPEGLILATKGLVKHAVTVSPMGLEKWIDGVMAYESQKFYPDPAITRAKIVEYWAKINGIFLYEKPTTEEIFTRIYFENSWKDNESVSGPGSSLKETETIRHEIKELIDNYEIKSLLDLPCGDFFWMRTVDLGIDYMGADIVAPLIHKNQSLYERQEPPRRRFITANLLEGCIPTADLLLCRDCLPHFSNSDNIDAIVNIMASNCKYILTTTFPQVETNVDIETGGWRPINLQKSPFNFPPPLELIDEKLAIENYGPKCLGLWAIKDLGAN